MRHGEISELLPASASVVFDLFHDYKRRLQWDTLLSEAYLDEGYVTAAKGATSVCVGRRWLGGLALRTVYVTFQPPGLAAVKMLNSPPFFRAWAASIRHDDLGIGLSRITYKFHFSARPKLLAFVLEPVMEKVFVWETKKRLRAMRAFLTKQERSQAVVI